MKKIENSLENPFDRFYLYIFVDFSKERIGDKIKKNHDQVKFYKLPTITKGRSIVVIIL